MSKLKPLKNLTNLTLAENPISSLPHYRLFLIFHLRSLEILDGQPVSPQDREQAHQRFHIGTPSHLLHLSYMCCYNMNPFVLFL